MRASVILILALSLATASSQAEVIHLKNGRTIWADQVRENGAHLEYDVGDDTYAILKASVEKVDAGGVRPEYASAANGGGAKEIPEFAPADSYKSDPALADKIIHDNKVDYDALSATEQQGSPRQTAAAYFLAGKYEFDRGNFSKARSNFETSLRFDGQNPTILNYYAALLVRTGNPAQALPYAERAVRIAPDSPDALAVLGYAQFAADHNQDAIQTWKKSLALRPDPTVQQYLAKAEREAKAEADYSERESSHFTLRYEGKQTSEELRREIIATLESEYDDLVREFGASPRASIPVILYTGQSFFDVTQAPSWSGAVNDGKLRIPVEGLTSVTSELARVLKHELAHSFINQLSGGRCPQWLHEGIAQAMEPKSLSSHGQRLAQLFHDQHEIPFNALEGSFMRFSPMEAVLAYDESLAAVDYISDTYGMSDLMRVLERLNEGSSTEAALRNIIHSDYGQLESEVGKYLVSKYGN
jgi:Tfp pilus assembly protein PilF